jgi:transglutaminase-like putative cysteine protease
MRYSISHRTRFKYAFPVRFARCNLRLKPIDWGGQTTEDHIVLIEPAAAQTHLRPSGYPVTTTRIVVDRPASELIIESRAHVTVNRVAPTALPDDPTVSQAAIGARELRDLSEMAPANYLFPSPLIADLSGDRRLVRAGAAARARRRRGRPVAGARDQDGLPL